MDGKKIIKSVVLGSLLLGNCLFDVKIQAAADEVASDVLSKDLDLPPNEDTRISNPRGPHNELYWTVFHRDLMAARKLLDKKDVDVNAIFPDGEVYHNGTGTDTTTLLGEAVYRGSLEMVKLLVEYGADPNQRRLNRFGLTVSPLTRAVRFAEPDIVKFLIENGADPHQRYDDNNTLLLKAMQNFVPHEKWVETVALLLDQGLDPNDKNDYGHTPLMQLVMEILRVTHEYFSHFGYNDPDDDCHLRDMRISNAEDTLQDTNYMLKGLELLVNRGTDINAQDNDGRTPLHWAIMPHLSHFNEENSDQLLCLYKHLNLKLLRKLLKLGANVNAEDNDEMRPLDLFALREKLLKNEYDLEAIMLLQKHGAERKIGYILNPRDMEYFYVTDRDKEKKAKINFLLKKVQKNELDKATTLFNEHGAVESQPRDEIESQPQEKDEAEDGEYNAEESEGADESKNEEKTEENEGADKADGGTN